MDAMKDPTADDVAIIGVGCRFPGEATSPDAFFDMLLKGRSAWSETPKDRWDVDAYHHPSYERQGTVVSRGGYYLKENIAAFDAPVFSITKGEADAMDPQQRLLLEVAYEALENAGIPVEKLAGSDTSCYVGGFTRDYQGISGGDINDVLLHTATGNSLGMLSNRLSWFYDIRGPSLSVETACSSSLVALHLACEAIRAPSSKTRMSLVGGVGLQLAPDDVVVSTQLHFFSRDSKCFSFDERANGYARGEGASILILKNVQDAIRDGDTIRGIIRATGVNQDGKTPGITVPSSQAQAQLIQDTYKNAGLSLSETKYFEAHGTGTAAGDPLEMQAIASSFGPIVTGGPIPLYVGTVKPNIGHTEAAAGVAGILKAIFVLESGQIPPNLNFKVANPKLRLKEWNFEVPIVATPWPVSGLRRVSVNSFGYGGTNAHAVLDDARSYLELRGLRGNTNTVMQVKEPSESATDFSDDEIHDSILSSPSPSSESQSKFYAKNAVYNALIPSTRLFVFSAPEQGAVNRLAKTYSAFLENLTSADLEDKELFNNLAFTLCSRRSVFSWRITVPASSTKELQGLLSGSSLQPFRVATVPKVVWVFTGQGAQWFAMGRELLGYKVFLDSIIKSGQYLCFLGAKWSLLDEFLASKTNTRINTAEISQPICAALQIAMVDLMYHCGAKPAAVVGHSSGEIAAAYAIGALSAEDCLTVAFHRGRLSQSIGTLEPHLRGSMMSVGLSETEFQPYLTTVESDTTVVVACVNSNSNVTVSGDSSALIVLESKLKAEGVFVRMLLVENAYHSPHMSVIADEYLESISTISMLSPTQDISMYSSVTGKLLNPSELLPGYWVKNMTSKVEFVKALNNVFPSTKGPRRGRRGQAFNMIVEVGPHRALQGPLQQILHANTRVEGTTYLSVLTRGKNAADTFIDTMGQLWTRGCKLKISHLNDPSADNTLLKCLQNLPSYPWNHSNTYWHENVSNRNHRFPIHPRLDLLGAPVDDFNRLEPRWRNILKISELPWLVDHKVHTDIIFPGASILCAVLEAARKVADPLQDIEKFEIKDILIGRALIIPESDPGVEVSLHLKQRTAGLRVADCPIYEFTFYSLGVDQHVEHASGLVKIQYSSPPNEVGNGAENEFERHYFRKNYEHAFNVCGTMVLKESLYEKFAAHGLHYGPTFQGLQEVRYGPECSCITIKIPNTKIVMPEEYEFEHLLHPATLDACFQAAVPEMDTGSTETVVPTTIKSISISANLPRGAGKLLTGIAKTSKKGFRETIGSLYIADPISGAPLIVLEGLSCTTVGSNDSLNNESEKPVRKTCAEIVYREDIDLLQKEEVQQILLTSPDDPMELSHNLLASQRAALIFIGRLLKRLTPVQESNLPVHLKKYLTWMRTKHELGNTSRLESQDNHEAGKSEEQFISGFADFGPANKMMTIIGKNLESIFDGSVAPLDLMVKDNMLSQIYTHTHGFRVAIQICVSWFDLTGHKRPDMRVLEVGAGTGSITLPILKILGGQLSSTPRFGSWVFTDISTGFFENASELLKDWQEYVEFKRLDIEISPEQQGFDPESFDVIAAHNVLHATKDIVNTLKNCYNLLKPGGQLVIGEITNPSYCIDLIFGTLPGWWLSEDGRVGGPTLSTIEWNQKLVEAGFSSIVLAIKDTEDPETEFMSTIIANKPIEPVVETTSLLIVHSQAGALTHLLALDLQRQVAKLGLEAEVTDISSAIAPNEVEVPYCHGKFVVSFLEVERSFWTNIEEEEFNTARILILQSSGILWVTCDTPDAGTGDPHLRTISGLFRSLRNEMAELKLHQLHLSMLDAESSEKLSGLIYRTLKPMIFIISQEVENEIVEQNGILQIPRIMPEVHKNREMHILSEIPRPESQLLLQSGRPLALSIEVPGILDTLHFIDDDTMLEPLQDHEVEVRVQANGLNFHDVMIAIGSLSEGSIGTDAAGIVGEVGNAVTLLKKGDRVALLHLGAMRTDIRVHESIPQILPESISINDGATLPTIFATAYQCLIEIGRLEKGESVLIHSAAGGFGQACIQIAQNIGAEIFVTVGSLAKQDLVVELGIPKDHIFPSRDLSFTKGIMRMTNGKGVDVVVNSLAGESLRKTWKCIAEFGRFIEVGIVDILANSGLEMLPFIRNASYMAVNLEHILRVSKRKTAYLMRKTFDLVRSGIIHAPTPVTVFDYSSMEYAFREMAQGKHTGKFVLSMSPQTMVPVIPLDTNPLVLLPKATYVLVGGLGGLGRGIASFLAQHGAKNLAFISRSGNSRPESQKLMEELMTSGVSARSYACDITDRSMLAAVISQIQEYMPPIMGVIQAAMVLQDGVFESMSFDAWKTATRPKVDGSWNLHELMPKDLDFFVMLASVSGVIGNRGQSNYAAGNSFQDALAHYRQSQGLAGRSVDLGAISGLGYVEENKDVVDKELLKVFNTLLVSPEQFWSIMKSCITGYSHGNHPIPTQLVIGAGTGGESISQLQHSGKAFWWLDQPLYAYYRNVDRRSRAQISDSTETNTKALLRAVGTLHEATEIIQNALMAKLAKAMMIPALDIDVSKPIHNYGVDSLVAIELRNWMGRELQSNVSVFEILASIPLANLAASIALKSGLVVVSSKEEE